MEPLSPPPNPCTDPAVSLVVCPSAFIPSDVELLIDLVVLAEDPPEQERAEPHHSSEGGIHSHQPGVPCRRAYRHAHERSKTGAQLDHSLHHAPHAPRGLLVRVLACRDQPKDLGDSKGYVNRKLQPHVDVVGQSTSVRCIAGKGCIVARSCIVDQALQTRGVGHSSASDQESGRDAGDGTELDPVLSEEVVQGLNDGAKDDTGDASHGLDHVVWDAVQVHLAGLGDEVVVHLGDGEVEEGE